MSSIHLHYDVSGEDFTRAGEASGSVKKRLKALGYNTDAIRRTAIAMYEAEINMVIHADGGFVDVDIYPDHVDVLLSDHGPGIPDVEKAMQQAWVCRTSRNTPTICALRPRSVKAPTCILPSALKKRKNYC